MNLLKVLITSFSRSHGLPLEADNQNERHCLEQTLSPTSILLEPWPSSVLLSAAGSTEPRRIDFGIDMLPYPTDSEESEIATHVTTFFFGMSTSSP